MDTSTVISMGALLVAFVGLILNSRKDTRSDAATTATNAIISTHSNSDHPRHPFFIRKDSAVRISLHSQKP